MDIKTAFLQGEKLQQKACECVYGLSDKSLEWFSRALKFVTENDGVVWSIATSLFLRRKCNVLLYNAYPCKWFSLYW